MIVTTDPFVALGAIMALLVLFLVAAVTRIALEMIYGPH